MATKDNTSTLTIEHNYLNYQRQRSVGLEPQDAQQNTNALTTPHEQRQTLHKQLTPGSPMQEHHWTSMQQVHTPSSPSTPSLSMMSRTKPTDAMQG
jgi:hypothetical protein